MTRSMFHSLRICRLTLAAIVVVFTCFLVIIEPSRPDAQKGEKDGKNDKKYEGDDIIDVELMPIPSVRPVGVLKHFERAAMCDDFVMDGEVKGQIEIEQELTLAYMQEHVRQRLAQQRQNGAIRLGQSKQFLIDMILELHAMIRWGIGISEPRVSMLKTYIESSIDRDLAEWRKSKKIEDLERNSYLPGILGEYLCAQEVFYFAHSNDAKGKAQRDPVARAAKKELAAIKRRVDESLCVLEALQHMGRNSHGWDRGSWTTPSQVASCVCGLLAARRMGHKLSPKTLDFLEEMFKRIGGRHEGWEKLADAELPAVKILWRPPVPKDKREKKHPKANADGVVELEVKPIGWGRRIRASAANSDGAVHAGQIDSGATGASMVTALGLRHLLVDHGRDPFASVVEAEFREAVWAGFAAIATSIRHRYDGDLEKYRDMQDLALEWQWASELAYMTGNQLLCGIEWYPIAARNAVYYWNNHSCQVLYKIEEPFIAEGKDRTHPDRVAAIRAHIASKDFQKNINGPSAWYERSILMLQGASFPRPKAATPVVTGDKGKSSDASKNADGEKKSDGGGAEKKPD